MKIREQVIILKKEVSRLGFNKLGFLIDKKKTSNLGI